MSASAAAQPVARDVLALYDSTEEDIVATSRIHRFAEFPLNHMGLRVQYWDVANGLPEWPTLVPDFVVSWFQAPVAEPAAYLAWMREASRRGLPIATLGTAGLPPTNSNAVENELLEIHGLSSVGYVPVTYNSHVSYVDAGMTEYECEPDPVLPAFSILLPTRDDVVTHFAIEAGAPWTGVESSLVSTSNSGGVAYSGYALCWFPELNQVRWLIDPFAFFQKAFNIPSVPVPDTTTLVGRRIYFSHIDGDGWNNVSEVSLPGRENPLSSEVINEAILRGYPDFPVGVGLIAGDVDVDFGAPPQSARIAQESFAMPNVEISVHGYTHPFFWWRFEDYDREAELEALERQLGELDTSPLHALFGLFRGNEVGLQVSRDYGQDLDLPRAYLQRPFSIQEEIHDAIAVANSLAPDGKRAQSFFWTGDTRPFPAAMAATVEAGVRNMNGGDSRFDNLYPSITNLSPLGRMVGEHRQIYTVNANDNIYTDGWTKDFHAMRLVRETVERTGAPLRLKPFNLYYHSFAGEKYSSLESLLYLHELAGTDEFIRVFPSRYIDTVEGFFSSEIEGSGENEWIVTGRGELQTLRIDKPGALSVDFAASVGVIGQRFISDALYISLDPEVETVRLKLGKDPRTRPHLVESSWEVRRFAPADCGLSLTASGFGEGRIVIAGLDVDADDLELEASRNGTDIQGDADSLQGGLLQIRLPTAINDVTVVNIRCR